MSYLFAIQLGADFKDKELFFRPERLDDSQRAYNLFRHMKDIVDFEEGLADRGSDVERQKIKELEAEAARLETEFAGVLGICPNCHGGEHPCEHWLVNEFERVYQEIKLRNALAADERRRRRDGMPTESLDADRELAGISPLPVPECLSPGVVDEVMDLFELSLRVVTPLDAAELDFPDRLGGGTADVWTARMPPTWFVLGESGAPGDDSGWRCGFSCGIVDGVLGTLGGQCGSRFVDPRQLLKHYAGAHLHCRSLDGPLWFSCRRCGLFNTEDGYCGECGVSGVDGVGEPRVLYGLV